MLKTVIGVFEYRPDAEAALTQLEDNGYRAQDISVIMRDSVVNAETTDNTNTGADVAGGALSGATTGAVIGGLAGLLTAFAIPGLGALLIGGPIAAALGLTGAAATTISGAATGAVAGGILGGLMGLGLPREQAAMYEERIKAGAILLAIPARENMEAEVEGILADNNATDVTAVAVPTETMRARTNTRITDRASDYDYDYSEPSEYQPRYATMGAKGGRTLGRRRTRKKIVSR